MPSVVSSSCLLGLPHNHFLSAKWYISNLIP
nr:MAG TPA: hypothetical protein [Caudoviricetes sp.]